MTELYPAQFYQRTDKGIVKCDLCPHNCRISSNKTGICQVRKNIKGKLYSLNYGQVSSLGIDPVEKKPLYHFHPQKRVLSLGSWGCNMSCTFCQNWQISQQKPELREFKPEEIVETALKKDIGLIAYTYSEPTVFYEYMLETAKIASEKGLKNILVSNGFINQKPLEKLIPFLDAANIDLKAFNQNFYQKECGGSLEPVKRTIEILAHEVHLEITNLIITELNDNLSEIEELFKWLAQINRQIPLHLSRYHPAYKLNKLPTDLEIMKKAYHLAKKHLDHVYLGNAIIENTADTYCNKCGEKLIKRKAYQVKNMLENNKCPECGTELYGEF